ncbi:MAG: hypothetical protein IJX64_05265 [Clostridia bacterium]|nr:hypothetical protein [Clostridia bacterium]
MTKTIAQLWNGNLEPVRHSGKNNSEMRQLEDLMQNNLEKLEAVLNENQKMIFEKYKNCFTEYMIVTVEQAFCDGFCMGTKIATEALITAEQLASN